MYCGYKSYSKLSTVALFEFRSQKMWRKQRMTIQETDAKRELPVYLTLSGLAIWM